MREGNDHEASHAMPSPFPGMDPYLEGELWSSFHAYYAVEIARMLNPRLVPRYVAVPEKYQNSIAPEEIGITTRPDMVVPDVAVSELAGRRGKKGAALAAGIAAPLKLDTVVTIPFSHAWIKILDTKRRRLVTAIEFLSPANKRGASRRHYLRKRRRLLLSQTHLVEIDLLRSGRRVPMADPLPAADYFVLLSRARQRPEMEVWPCNLNQPLPTVPIPLLNGDADVELALQEALSSVYDLGMMEYLIDYREQPDVPLPRQWQSWANQLLGDAGKRPRGSQRKA